MEFILGSADKTKFEWNVTSKHLWDGDKEPFLTTLQKTFIAFTTVNRAIKTESSIDSSETRVSTVLEAIEIA